MEGIYTQLHGMKPGDPEAARQLEQFHTVLDTIHAAGFETGTVHAAGSFALLHNDSARLDGGTFSRVSVAPMGPRIRTFCPLTRTVRFWA